MGAAAADFLLGGLRLAHALAAALWVGGALVYALAPQARQGPTSPALRETFAAGVGVFVITGAILALQRLSSAPVPPLYVALLALKAVVGLWMFTLVRRLGSLGNPSTQARWRQPEWQLAGAGVLVYALAIALRTIYEEALRP